MGFRDRSFYFGEKASVAGRAAPASSLTKMARTSFSGSIFAFLLILLFLLAAGMMRTSLHAEPEAGASQAAHEFVFDRLNQAYRDLAPVRGE